MFLFGSRAPGLSGAEGFMRSVHPRMIVMWCIIMRATLHEGASNTYSGQWIVEKAPIYGPGIAFHCP
jgi:hypothetical protein